MSQSIRSDQELKKAVEKASELLQSITDYIGPDDPDKYDSEEFVLQFPRRYLRGATGPESYSVSMTYDNMGGIVQKNQTASLNYPGYPGEKYNYYYTQGNTAHPHATSKVWDRRNHKQYTYGFDSNGNPTTTYEQYAPPLQGQPNPSGPIDLIQQNYWDEQNQLRGLWNLSGLHHYIYDADGQRLMKSSVPMSYSSVNAQQLQATNSIAAEDYTVYVSAGLVYESNRGSTTYTKHYYAGPLRVASQIGSENPNYETHPVGGQIAPGGPVNTTPESYGEAVLSDLNTLLANYGMAVDANEPPQDTLSMQVINDPDECRMFYGDDLIEENRCLCDNFPDIAIQQGIDCNPYAPIYWYHPDYIGNIEFVTDRTGQPYQHFYYAAFGDPLVSQHVGTGSFNSTFRFNAKEFDEETGNYYYGARYYQPKSSIWMGVDAMATSYPGMNPYNFTMGNPIMAIDPDGDKPINPKFWKRGWNNYFNIKVIGIYEKSSSPFAYDSDLILAGDLIQSSTEQAKESPWASFGNNFASRPKDEFVSGDEFYDRKGNNNPIAAYKYDLASGPSKVSAGQSGNYDYRREILFSNSFEIVSVKDGVIYEIKLYKQNSEGKHQLSSTTCYETEFVKRGEEKFYNGSEIVIKTIFDVKVQEVITDHQTGEVHSSDYIHTGETQLNKIDLN